MAHQLPEEVENRLRDGKPYGGHYYSNGVAINWQKGPLGRGEDRKAPNGAFVEDVIYAAKQRLEHYQTTEFNCAENALAIVCLNEALSYLHLRTKYREARGVEGTWEK